MSLIEIDADFRPLGGEAGGQVIRMIAASINFLPLGTILQVNNIRIGRPGKKGLRPQHVQCLELIREICGCRLDGVSEHSMTVTLESVGFPNAGTYQNVPLVKDSAASVTLILQCILPVLLFAPGQSAVHLTGGLEVKYAPPLRHTMEILQPILGFFTVEIIKDVSKDEGGGQVMLKVNGLDNGKSFPPLNVQGIDKHIVDQLIIYMALAGGRSIVSTEHELSTHTKSQIILMNMLFPMAVFSVTNQDNVWKIICDGINFHIK